MSDSEIYSHVGENIKSLREKKFKTQLQLANALGMTRTSIANIEKGTQRAPLDVLYKIAEVLGCNSITQLIPDLESVISKPAKQSELFTASTTVIHGGSVELAEKLLSPRNRRVWKG